MVQPEGFVDPEGSSKVCKLQRSIYGLTLLGKRSSVAHHFNFLWRMVGAWWMRHRSLATNFFFYGAPAPCGTALGNHAPQIVLFSFKKIRLPTAATAVVLGHLVAGSSIIGRPLFFFCEKNPDLLAADITTHPTRKQKYNPVPRTSKSRKIRRDTRTRLTAAAAAPPPCRQNLGSCGRFHGREVIVFGLCVPARTETCTTRER